MRLVPDDATAAVWQGNRDQFKTDFEDDLSSALGIARTRVKTVDASIVITQSAPAQPELQASSVTAIGDIQPENDGTQFALDTILAILRAQAGNAVSTLRHGTVTSFVSRTDLPNDIKGSIYQAEKCTEDATDKNGWRPECNPKTPVQEESWFVAVVTLGSVAGACVVGYGLWRYRAYRKANEGRNLSPVLFDGTGGDSGGLHERKQSLELGGDKDKGAGNNDASV